MEIRHTLKMLPSFAIWIKLDGIRSLSLSSISLLHRFFHHRSAPSLSRTSLSMLILAISSASSDLSDRAKYISLSLPPCTSFPHLHLELSLANVDRRDRSLQWQSSTPRLLLLCPTRTMFVPSTLHHTLSPISVQGSSPRRSKTTFSLAKTTTTSYSSVSSMPPPFPQFVIRSSISLSTSHVSRIWLNFCMASTLLSVTKVSCFREWVLHWSPFDEMLILLIIAAWRDRRREWTWHEPCIVMQTSICWMIHCRRWTWKCRSISFRSECERGWEWRWWSSVCLLVQSSDTFARRSASWSHIRSSSCKMPPRSSCSIV